MKVIVCPKVIILLLVLLLTGACQARADTLEYQRIEGGNEYLHPSWSPDGSQLLFVDEQFVVYDVETREHVSLPVSMDGVTPLSRTAWLDNERIGYTRFPSDPQLGERPNILAVYDLNTHEEQVLLSGHEIYEFCWSEPAEMFVLVLQVPENREFPLGNTVRAFDPATGEMSSLYRTTTGREIVSVTCSPDTAALALADLNFLGEQDESELFTISLETGERELLLAGTYNLNYLTASPDGNWLAVRSVERRSSVPLREILLLRLDTPTVETIKLPIPPEMSPQEIVWSPAGNELLVRSGPGFQRHELYLIDLGPIIEGSQGALE